MPNRLTYRYISLIISFFFFLLSGNTLAGLLIEPDPDWKESEHTLPPPPLPENLKAFEVNVTSPNQYLVDLNSISIGTDTVVRYTLVIQTPSGARNVTYEGIRCQTKERQLYATARADGTWIPVKKTAWQPFSNSAYHRPAVTLAEDFFCDGNAPPHDQAEILRHFNGIFDHTDPTRGIRP